jgi:hypothetical protein
MKKILTILFCIALLTISCEDKGVTSQRLTGDEPTLPAELKGLKVYRVSCGDNEYVKVGILNNQVVSTTYQSGKHSQSIILVNKENSTSDRTINVESIISENDSIIVIKKSK